ncbi:MAG: Cro/CI family transcriptional regulator [Pseudomonadota bacterium]
MKTSEVIGHFGTQQKAADAMGLHQTTVCGWGEYPPDLRQIQIERITRGKLKAEASCYLPKLKASEPAKAPAA